MAAGLFLLNALSDWIYYTDFCIYHFTKTQHKENCTKLKSYVTSKNQWESECLDL